MKDELTTTEREMAAAMLRMAGGAFAENGCNDFPIPDTPANRVFARAVLRSGRGPGHPESETVGADGRMYLQDWEVADYLADRLSPPKAVPLADPLAALPDDVRREPKGREA